ncbi:MAG: hypothetical protein FDX18_07395 [Chlorobium sp.]|nr:MAG: hypothetical protein FDX18_07395 [Chlorobium sp.]
MKQGSAALVTGLILAATFTGIALYILFSPGMFPSATREDLRLYALLTGAYGLWRFIRVWLAWREGEENSSL